MASFLGQVVKLFSPNSAESRDDEGQVESSNNKRRQLDHQSTATTSTSPPHAEPSVATADAAGLLETIEVTGNVDTTAEQTGAVTPTIPQPRRVFAKQNEAVHRMRSISKVFNILPSTLPRARDMWRDVLEFICHVLLLETDVHRHSQCLQDFEYVSSKNESPPSRGRLFTRVKLASLASDITCLRLEEENVDDHQKHGPPSVRSSLSVTAEEWKRQEEEWVMMKSYLLRPDANTYVSKEDEEKEVDDHKEDDSNVEDHVMFQGDYRAVGRLLHYQHVLAVWREEMNLLLEGDAAAQDSALLLHSVEALQNSWGRLGVWSEGATSIEVPPDIEAILVHLRPCIGKEDADLFACIKMAVKKCNDLLLQGDSNELSHSHLQHAMRSLLIKWSESVLDTPVLFQLGYGGVSAPVADADQEDDVSSWGGDDVEDAPRRRGARTRKRSRSTSEIPPEENQADHDEIMNNDDDDMSEAREKTEDPAVQRERQAHFVAQKRVLLNSPRTSMSSAVSNVDDANNTHKVSTDKLPSHLPLLRMPLLSVGEKVRTHSTGGDAHENGPGPISRDVFSQQESQLQQTQNSNNTEWSETQDPDDVAMLGTQPDSIEASGPSRGEKSGSQEHDVDDPSTPPTRFSLKPRAVGNLDSRGLEPALRREAESPKTPQSQQQGPSSQSQPESESEFVTQPDSVIQAFKSPLSKEKSKAKESNTLGIRDLLRAHKKQRLDAEKSKSSERELQDGCSRKPEHDENRSPRRSTGSDAEKAIPDIQSSPIARNRKKAKRLPFSESELDAIREGVDRFGVGHWEKMISHDHRLRKRDAVQIRNKYRHLLRCNEL